MRQDEKLFGICFGRFSLQNCMQINKKRKTNSLFSLLWNFFS